VQDTYSVKITVNLDTYVEDQIQQNPNDVNTAWKTIRSCMPKRSVSTKNYSQDEKSVANEFNNFFTSIGEVTRQKVQSLANEYGHISSQPFTLDRPPNLRIVLI
jgi:hypothetical protein